MVHLTDTFTKTHVEEFQAGWISCDQWESLPWSRANTVQSEAGWFTYCTSVGSHHHGRKQVIIELCFQRSVYNINIFFTHKSLQKSSYIPSCDEIRPKTSIVFATVGITQGFLSVSVYWHLVLTEQFVCVNVLSPRALSLFWSKIVLGHFSSL